MVRKNIKLRVKNLVNKMDTASPIQIAAMLHIPIVYAPLPGDIRGYITRPLRRQVPRRVRQQPIQQPIQRQQRQMQIQSP